RGGVTARFRLAARFATVGAMTTIADIRERVRRDLSDIDPEERWADEQLDRHIERALNELSLSIPREATANLSLAPGRRTVSVAALGDLIAIEAVEYPVDEYPPVHVAFSHWDDDVMLHLERPGEGGDVRLYYLARHTIDETGTTLRAPLEDVLATGAGAY